MNYAKRLIEVDLPIKRISAHARREKSIRHGHISTLHIWWARRPLAACRAVICASLWPDPADELCPEMFRKVAREQMTNWAKNRLNLLSEESWSRFVAISKDECKLDDLVELRAALLDFIADFANWDSSTVPEYLETSRLLTQVAHEALGDEPGSRPLVVDPFAGGGSIPLEALRVGADAFASDLNPVAVLLNKVVLEYIPKYGQKLGDEVRKWGQWIKDKAEKELAEFYPKDPDGATPIAYLWARTIQCEGPGCGAEVPLMRSLWLAKRRTNSVALRMITRQSKKRVEFEIVENANATDVADGTVARGKATCPVCGYTTPVQSVREQLRKKRGGANDARLFCVVTTRPGQKGRFYRLPTERDLTAVRKAAEELKRREKVHKGELSLVPDEPLPPIGSLGFRVQRYGMLQWGDLFSSRQLLTLTTLSRLVHEAGSKLSNDLGSDVAKAVQSFLALAVDRQADYLTSLVVWANTGEFIAHTFGRQALPIVWEWPECNLWQETSGNWLGAIGWIKRVIDANASDWTSTGLNETADATRHPLPNNSSDLYFTDPPYYDAVPYADLSDFFYVWLKRTLPNLNTLDLLTPKDEECIVDETKNKNHEFFEKTMQQAMHEGCRILAPSGVGVVVFAHKSTAGWEAQLQSMIEAGWTMTGSWPIDTERPGRLRAQDSAALASSVHIVMRPRENLDGSLRTDDIGDWRDVLAELPRRIHEWMPRLAEEGVVGADAIFACLGPALEIYSRYSSVEKASGEKVSLSEYLEEVWAAVSREALNMIFDLPTGRQGAVDASGFEEDARLTAMWLWTLRTVVNGGDPDVGDDREKTKRLPGFSLEYDAARLLAQGLGAHLENLSHLVEIKGSTATLLSAAARTRYLFGKDAAEAPRGKRKKQTQQIALDFASELEQVEEDAGGWSGELGGKAGSTVLDQLHQSMILFAAGRGEAMKRFLVEEGVGRNPLFWRLAQALSALYPTNTDEKRWVDGVLARKKGLGF